MKHYLLSFTLVFLSVWAQAQIMDNGTPVKISSVDIKAIKAVATADVLVCDTLNSVLTPSNGFKAVCFNVVAKAFGNIQGFGVVISSAVPASSYLRIYKRAGSAIGKNMSSAGWTYIDSIKVYKGATTADTLFAANLFTTSINYLNMDTVGLFLGFHDSSPLTLKYENGSVLNGIKNQDLYLQVRTGYGGTLFNASQSPRDMGGYISYCCLPGGSVQEDEKKLGLKVFPNPATDQIDVSIERGHFYLEVYSAAGDLVLKDRSISAWKKIDIRSLTNGTYTMKLYTDDKKMTVKQFVVNR